MAMVQPQSQSQLLSFATPESPSLHSPLITDPFRNPAQKTSNGSSPASTSSSKAPVPRVGGVRCYWALVTPRFPIPGINGSKLELKFVHPDPVLSVHLARQQMTLVGHDMLEFIHPSERDQARRDLEEAMTVDDLQGSVTRVRFARLSRIREILGGTKDEIEYPTDAKTFVEDDEYLILDLTLGWVADGVLLAFFHAIKDKDPVANNDFARRHEEWSNYCGTSHMAEEQIQALHSDMTQNVPFRSTGRPPVRVFQLYTTAEAPTRPDQLLFSWPPPRPGNQPTQDDGRYYAEDYTSMMRKAGIASAQQAPDKRQKTNCQARYAATDTTHTEGLYRVVSSVYIPYGTLIFACYQTVRQVEAHPARSSSTADDSSPDSNSSSNATTSVIASTNADSNPNSQSLASLPETPSMSASSSTSPWNVQSPQNALSFPTASSGYIGSSSVMASSSPASFAGSSPAGTMPLVGPSNLSNERSEPTREEYGNTPPSVSQFVPQSEYTTPHVASSPDNEVFHVPPPPQHGRMSVDDMMNGGRSEGPSTSQFVQRPPGPLWNHHSREDPHYQRPIEAYGPPPPHPHPHPHAHSHSHHPHHLPPPHQSPYQDYPPHQYPRHEHHPPSYYHQDSAPHPPHYSTYPPPPPPPPQLPLLPPLPPHHPYHHPQAQGSQSQASYPGPSHHETEEHDWRSGPQQGSDPYRTPDGWTSELPRIPGGGSNVGGSNTRPLIPPPMGIACCIACGTEEAPEWRKSDAGVKELCNACGLRHARQVAKRDGKKRQARPPVDK